MTESGMSWSIVIKINDAKRHFAALVNMYVDSLMNGRFRHAQLI